MTALTTTAAFSSSFFHFDWVSFVVRIFVFSNFDGVEKCHDFSEEDTADDVIFCVFTLTLV